MSISSKIEEIALNKSVIKAAIAAKAPKVPPTDALSQWPKSIMSIETGKGPIYNPPFEYVRPSDWPDLETILAQHPASEKGYGYAYAMLVEGQSPVSVYNYIEVPSNSAGCRHYVTSWGLDEDCPNTSQRWVLSDPNTYSKYEWIVVYTDSASDLTTWGPRYYPYVYRWLVWFYAPGATITNDSYGFSGIKSIREFTAKQVNGKSTFFGFGCGLPCSVNIEKYVDIETTNRVNGSFFPSYLIGNVEFEIEMGNNVVDIHDFLSYQYYITSIKPFSIPSSVTKTGGAFSQCFLLTSLDLSKWDTSGITDMNNMFYRCLKLKYIDASGWNVEKVSTMNNMFYECRHLVSIYGISDWNTTAATTFLQMFYACESLCGSIDLSKWDASNVTSTQSMFNACKAVESLDVSGWNVSKLTTTYSMFSDCYNLSEINFSGWDFKNSALLTNVAQMFANCLSLREANLSGWDTRNITSTASMFSYCRGIESVDMTGWDFSNVTTTSSTFYNCNLLRHIYISGTTMGSVTNMSSMFNTCWSLREIDVSEWDTSSVANMNSIFANCISLERIDVSSWDMSNVTDATSMFNSCHGILSIKMPDIDKVYASQFSNCNSCLIFDFRKCTSVPILTNTNAFGSINANAHIVVPDALYSSWIAASNWSNNTIKSHIISVTDYEAL